MNEDAEKHVLSIPFESFSNRGIHREDSDSFRSSFFKDVYYQAAQAVNMIYEANKSNNNDASNKFYAEQNVYDIQNVIAFTGRRGTGKTSAMLSFLQSLLCGECIDSTKECFRNTRFYSFPYIDASMLQKEEDIFEIVLSKMMLELNNKMSNPRFHAYSEYEVHFNDARESIVKVYNQYATLKKSDNFDSASSCSMMEKKAEKHNIRSQIVELMREYIECMAITDYNPLNRSAHENSGGYLVICIDDIDNSPQNHVELMQSIYQYLMIPRVIVMISLNLPMLLASIEKDFFSKINISASQEQRVLNLCREQAYDFLKKIIPFDMRLTMPSWRKQDYRSLTVIKVDLKSNENIDSLKESFPKLKEDGFFEKFKDKTITPKELIMLILAYRTKIYLDVAGERMHFMEPDSLRNLNDLFYLLYNMNNISEEKSVNQDNQKKYYLDLEANRKLLLNYLYFKMIPEYNFPYEIEQFLKDFSKDTIQRKGRKIWDYYYKLLSQESEREKIERLYGRCFYDDEIKKNNVDSYSFGELFRVLYFGSRLNLISKDFVKVILASFSFIMPQFIEIEKCKANNTETSASSDGNENKDKKYKEIGKTFRYTLLGTWCLDLNDGKTVDIVVKNSLSDEGGIKTFLKLMMLSPVATEEKIGVIEKGNQHLVISAKLDPTAFIINTVRKERMSNIRFSFKNHMYKLADFISKVLVNESSESKVGKVMEDLNSDLNNNSSICWFMLKNIDFSYSVIKRATAYQLYKSDTNLKAKSQDAEPYEVIQSFYERLIIQLGNENFYSDYIDIPKFDESFKIHPIVKLFENDESKFNNCGLSLQYHQSSQDKSNGKDSDVTKPEISG